MNWQGHPDQKWGGYTYAQHGEDMFLLDLFWQIGIKKPSFLDIGAHHPVFISNTALMYLHGGRGISVEANPNLIAAFHEVRPEDINLNVGVAPQPGILPFYMFDEGSGRNTFSLDEAAIFMKESPQHSIQKSINIEMKTITDIVQTYAGGVYPDFLSMDIEGLDYDVLVSADFSISKPKVICTEVRKEDEQPTKDLLAARGYFPLCRMISNLIFVQNEYESAVR